MSRIIIFAGTTEGRELSCWLASRGVQCTVSVATEYGSLLMPEDSHCTIREGRLSHEQMKSLFLEENYCCAVDATHPFAVAVSAEIQKSCADTRIPYFRLARKTDISEEDAKLCFNSMTDAAQYLERQAGKIFVTTGSKELPVLVQYITDNSRLVVRVLPSAESIDVCNRCGISGKQIIAMQGPFSQDMNELQFRETHAAFLLTKETGLTGGYAEKIAAAKKCGVIPVIIRNPEHKRQEGDVRRYQFGELLSSLSELTGIPLEQDCGSQREIVLAGIGPGDVRCMTEEVRQALSEAEVIFGAPRLVPQSLCDGTSFVPYYRPDQIFSYLEAHPFIKHPAVVFSGDSGFYSGASSFLRSENDTWTFRTLCGISSLSYFSSRIGIPYHDWTLLSCHGRPCNVIGKLRTNRRCFLLLSGCSDVQSLGERILCAQQNGVLKDVRVTLGFQLTYPEEQIVRGSAGLLKTVHAEGLYVLLLEHDDAVHQFDGTGLPDEMFLRDNNVPMTKSEVRALLLSRLRLTKDAVMYDIGSGSGSVTVESARLCPDGTVFAIECDCAALTLTKRNVQKFSLENVSVIDACAPEGLDVLPAPTHVFIGGSNGHMEEILRKVLEKNPAAHIVISSVTMETFFEVQSLLKELPVTDVEIVQVMVNRLQMLGTYHFLKPQNPVFVISCNGKSSVACREGIVS